MAGPRRCVPTAADRGSRRPRRGHGRRWPQPHRCPALPAGTDPARPRCVARAHSPRGPALSLARLAPNTADRGPRLRPRSNSGPGRIRTSVGDAGGFTARSLWPLGHRPWNGTTLAPRGRATTRERQRRPGPAYLRPHAQLRRRLRGRHPRGPRRGRPGRREVGHPLRLQGHEPRSTSATTSSP